MVTYIWVNVLTKRMACGILTAPSHFCVPLVRFWIISRSYKIYLRVVSVRGIENSLENRNPFSLNTNTCLSNMGPLPCQFMFSAASALILSYGIIKANIKIGMVLLHTPLVFVMHIYCTWTSWSTCKWRMSAQQVVQSWLQINVGAKISSELMLGYR